MFQNILKKSKNVDFFRFLDVMTGTWPSSSPSGSLAVYCLKVPSANSKCPEVEKTKTTWEKLRVIDSEFDALSRNSIRFAWEFTQTLPKKSFLVPFSECPPNRPARQLCHNFLRATLSGLLHASDTHDRAAWGALRAPRQPHRACRRRAIVQKG